MTGSTMRQNHKLLRLALLLAAMIVGCASGCSSIQWERSFEAGLKRAATQRRRALVQFYSAVDGDCMEMDRKVFSDSDVQDLMHNFVAIRLDSVLNRKLTEQFNVQTVPTFFVIRPDGQVAGSTSGVMDTEKFRIFLIKYSYN